jgi:hypothetical protein
MVANLMFQVVVMEPLRGMILPWNLRAEQTETVLRNVLLTVAVLFCTIVTAPLEVIATRLALQRNYGGLTLTADNASDAESALAVTAETPAAVSTPVSPVLVPGQVQEAQTPATTDVEGSLSEKALYPVDKPEEGPTVAAQPAFVPAAPTDLERGPITISSDDIVVQYVYCPIRLSPRS